MIARRAGQRPAARHEAAGAIHAALAGLKLEYRQAIELRYIQQLPVAEIAARMDRTERAVHMLCNRGLKQLEAAMGCATRFITRKG
jgi:RNA polymerase sigma-70 factor (ECF subfamily)